MKKLNLMLISIVMLFVFCTHRSEANWNSSNDSLGVITNEDAMYVTNYTLSEGTLDLNGTTMYVDGDFLHTGGTLNLGSGKLVIFGNYHIAAADGGTCSAILKMMNENGHILVYGDFVINSNNNENGHTYLTAGTLELKGNFLQKSTTDTYGYTQYNFSTDGTHTVLLSGTGDQIISFEDPTNSHFTNLKVTNQSGLVNFKELPIQGELQSNLISNSDINLYDFDLTLNGHTIKTPNLCMYSGGNLTLSDNVKIDANLLQYTGMANLTGIVEITGNYHITAADGGTCSAILKMMNENGHMLVYGDFVTNTNNNNENGNTYLTAGTLEIKGNFSQKATTDTYGYTQYDFSTDGTHTVVLSGTGEQIISFENPTSSHFTNLKVTNQSGLVNFKELPIQGELQSNLISNSDINLYDFNLTLAGHTIKTPNLCMYSGGTLTLSDNVKIDANLLQYTGTANLTGSVEIMGNYHITAVDGGTCSAILKMINENGHMLVYGDFVTNTNNNNENGYTYLTAGTLELKGNFSQKATSDTYGYAGYNFSTDGTHTVVLSGANEQIISFENPTSSNFTILINKNPNRVLFATEYRYAQLKTIYPFDFNVVEYNPETNQINVDIYINENLQKLGGILIISLYDETNKLIEYRDKELSELETQTFNGLNEYDGNYVVKAFYWTDINSITPLCSSIQTEI